MSEKLQSMHVRVNDAATGKPTPVRVRFTDEAGTYFAPLGRIADFSKAAHADLGGNVFIKDEPWAYVDGTFEILLPPGRIHIRVVKGSEYREIDEYHTVQLGRLSMRLTIERIADLRAEGWYSGDVACYSLTPHAALLEAAGEDLAVVNLLVTERDHEGKLALDNITAFSGQSPALEMPGHLVAVNTRNDSNLGNLILLHAHRTVYPLSFDARKDSWILEDWCDQCHRKKGLVIAEDHFFRAAAGSDEDPWQANEMLAEMVRGKIDALMISENYLYDDWYELLNAGIRIPAVAGTLRGWVAHTVGDPRTYAWIGSNAPLNYTTWIESVRAGRSWIGGSSGHSGMPLLRATINGKNPGDTITDEERAGGLRVTARIGAVEPMARCEVIVNGEVVAQLNPSEAKEISLPEILHGGWIAVRCHSEDENLWAHTNPIWLEGPKPPIYAKAREWLSGIIDQTLAWARQPENVANDRAREHLIQVHLEAKNLLRP